MGIDENGIGLSEVIIPTSLFVSKKIDAFENLEK